MKFKLVEDLSDTNISPLEEGNNLFTAASSFLGQRNSHISNNRGNGSKNNISKYVDVHHISGNHDEKPNAQNCIVTTKKLHKAMHNETVRRLINWAKGSVECSNLDDDTLTRLFSLLALEERDSTTQLKREKVSGGITLDKFQDAIKILRGAKAEYETLAELVAKEFMQNPEYKGEWMPYNEENFR